MRRIIIIGLYFFCKTIILSGQVPVWEWVNALHSPDYEIATDVAAHPFSGDLFLVGQWNGSLAAIIPSGASETTDFAATFGGADGFVVKLDKDGIVQWAFKVGGEGNDRISAVHLDQDGNFYITGYMTPGRVRFTGTGSLTADSIYQNTVSMAFYLAKYNPDGNLMWVRYSGGNARIEGLGICSNSSGVFASGHYRNSASFGGLQSVITNGDEDMFLLKYTSEGLEEWLISGSSNKMDVGKDIACDEAEVYITGEFYGDSFSLRNVAGDIVYSVPNSVPSQYEIFISSYSNEGLHLWSNSVASLLDDYSHGITMDNDKLYLTGSIGAAASFPFYAGNPVAHTGMQDAFICSISRLNGSTEWVRTLTGGSGEDQASHDISRDLSGNLFLTGYFQGQIQTELDNAGSTGSDDIFVASYSGEGVPRWLKTAGSSNIDQGTAISAVYPGSIFASGWYSTDLASFDAIDLPADGIENVFVGRLTPSCVDAFGGTLLAGETAVCSGDSVSLSLTAYQGAIEWQSSPPGLNTWTRLTNERSDTIAFIPSMSADYRALVSSGICAPDSSNVVYIEILPPPPADAGSDLTINEGDVVQLLGSGGDSLWWNPDYRINDQALPNPLVDPLVTTTYILTAFANSGCTAVDSVTITVLPPLSADAGPDITICQGDSVRLLASGGDFYQWNSAVSLDSRNTDSPWVRPQSTTTYVVSVSNILGVTDTDTVTVFVVDWPLADAGPDQALVSAEETFLEATLGTGETGLWTLVSGQGRIEDPSLPDTRVSMLEIGDNVFEWQVNNGVCPVVSDQVIIRVNDFVIPTVITPNGDGKNDQFHVEGIDRFTSSELTVLDSWGTVVYSSAPYRNEWKGTNQSGQELPEGTYYTVLKITPEDIRKGYVLIIR